MGDRTYVKLYVPLELKEKALEVVATSGYHFEDEEEEDDLYFLGFNDVNYGELLFLEELAAAGIAYDSSWDAGGEYGAGTESLRFLENGESEITTVYDNEADPPLDTLMKFITDLEIDQLVKYIQHWKDDTTPASWDNQVEYGQRHRTVNLIS